MDPRTAAAGTPDPDAVEFVRFCYRRRRVGWPELYDEMCAVAGRGLFRGYDADDLGKIGIGFSLFDMPALAVLSARVIGDDQALRRPVAVVIAADQVTGEPIVHIESATPGPAPVAVAIAQSGPPPVPVVEERSFDVPIRLALAPSGA